MKTSIAVIEKWVDDPEDDWAIYTFPDTHQGRELAFKHLYMLMAVQLKVLHPTTSHERRLEMAKSLVENTNEKSYVVGDKIFHIRTGFFEEE